MDPEIIKLREQNNYLRQIIAFQDNNSENIFQQLSDNIDDVFWLRTDDEMIYINPAFEKVWGISCAEIYQKPQIFLDSIHPDDREKVVEILNSDGFKKTGLFEYEYRIVRPDKKVCWISAKSLPLVNDSGEIIRRVGVARDITEQKKSLEETGMLAEMLDVAPNSITIHDNKGIIFYANQKTFEIHGYSREEFMALSLFTLDVPASADLIEERIKIIQEKGQAKFEVEHFKKDGTRIPLEVFVKLADWKGSQVMLSIATDISERKKAEQALKDSEVKFRTLVENANDIIYQITPEGVFSYVSPNWTEILGYQQVEVIGEKVEKFTHPDDLPRCMDFLNKVLSTGGKQSGIEYRVKHKNGNWRWHNSNGAPLKDEKGNIVSFLGVARDITEKTQAQQKLLLSETKYKAAFHTSPDSVNINKLNGEFVEINEGFTRLTGFTEEDVLSKLSSEINIWAIPEDRLKFIDDLKNKGIVENFESLFRTKNGKLIPALLSAKIIDINNEPHILSVTRDIADRKNYEQQIIQQYEEYEALNEELRQTNEELYTARKIAEESAEKYRLLYENAGLGIGYYTPDGVVISFNVVAASHMNGKPENFAGKSVFDLFPPEKANTYFNRLKNATISNTSSIYEDLVELPNENKWFLSTFTKIVNSKDDILGIQIISQDITEQKKSIAALQQIEWMLTEKHTKNENPLPEYGDLSKLNSNGLILSSVGKEQLIQIVSEYLDLLETSSAIYEKNGDYALGLFSSSWCQTMDDASRKLCHTESNEEALNCGKWLCHESCWRDASLNAIDSGRPTDVKCKGGLRLFAVPIQANGKVIGAINFGYGQPPIDEDELQNLSSLYQIPIEELRKKRQEYQIRPQYIIDFAKKRIQLSAQYIGNLIERKQAEQLLQEKSKEIAAQNEELYQTNQELIKAKDKAEENERRVRSMFSSSNAGFVVIDLNGKLIEWNETFQHFFGYQSQEFEKLSTKELTYPDDITLTLDNIYKIKTNQIENFRIEKRFVRKDKSVFWVDLFASPLKKGNTVVALLGIVNDISDRKNYESKLILAKEKAEESEQRFKSLIENAPDGVVILDESGKFVYGSPNAARHFGYTENEIIGHSGDEYTHPDDLPLVLKTFETIFIDPLQKPKVKYRFKRKDGEFRWIETTFTNLLSDKAINGIILNFTDITERRQILEDLLIAKEKAEESDRLKTAFLHNMSHEIRTPMNAIMGFSELLLKNFENKEKLQKFVSIINQRCSDLLVIIDDILDIAKIESGQLQVNEEKVNISKLLQELETIFNEQKLKLNKCDIRIVFKNLNQSTDLHLITDRSRLMQIFTNLISNALKFTFQGKIEFGFNINNRQLIEFYVSDSGIGIPKEKQDVIFERFVQLNEETSRFMGGNGLGLAITKGLVKMLGGSIWVQSEVEIGSTFYFTIKTIIDSNNIFLLDNKIEDTKPDCFDGKIVMVVEDDEFNKALIKEILDNLGLNLIFVENALESIQMCLTTSIDLILMDIGLPDISGYEAIKQILSDNSDIKIIAQTAFASASDKNKALKSGCIDYISKPLKSSELIEIIKRHI